MSDKPPHASTPYGSWPSPITCNLIVAESLRLGEPMLDGDTVYWLEGRPSEGGRTVLVRREGSGDTADVTPEPFNVRSRAHEYGGGAYAVSGHRVWFVNFDDQCLYVIGGAQPPRRVTTADGRRFADLVPDSARNRVICVCENHDVEGEAQTTVVSIAMDTGAVTTLLTGYDFYSSPVLSADGSRLAWLCWRHPDMPWDNTELWCADLDSSGHPAEPRRIAGGDDESIFQPAWSGTGVLVFVSDRSGWWNLYAHESGATRPLAPASADYGVGQWVFGMRTYGFTAGDELVAASTRDGVWRLERIGLERDSVSDIALPFSSIEHVHVADGAAVLLAGAPDHPMAVVRVDLASGAHDVLAIATKTRIDERYLSRPESIRFTTSQGDSAHALYYPPYNTNHQAPPTERPPLLVICHGGPTAATSSSLDLRIQYWTSRGIAVLDVNYRGSTGYGRAYRNRLRGQWGVYDVEDAIHGARHLVDKGLADPDRLIIRGGSAGGYTVLCALTFHDTFSAGASYYGVGDLEVLMADTHKFESRYGDRLLGPLPEALAIYRERSPVRHADRLRRPVIFFQGLDDRVVPPNQTRIMYEAIRRKGIPVACLEFEGEGHGFRRSDTIVRTLQAELGFYGKILGFAPADSLPDVHIDNLGTETGIYHG